MKTLAFGAIIVATVFGLMACAHRVLWNDVTDQRRGQSQFTMDSGNCERAAQRAGYRQEALVNQENANGCRGTKFQCGAVGALQGMSIGNARNDAYAACMHSAGWAEQASR